jgi:hypothetical protein
VTLPSSTFSIASSRTSYRVAFQSALLRPLESWSTGRSRPRAPHPRRPSHRRGGDVSQPSSPRRSAPAGAHCARDRPDRRRACTALSAMRARTVPGRVAPAAPHTRRSSPTVMTSPRVRLLSTSRRHRRSPRCLSGAARRRADGAWLPRATELARSALRVATAASATSAAWSRLAFPRRPAEIQVV